MKTRLLDIAESEKCTDSETALVDDILDFAEGDMRRAVATLQTVHSLALGGEQVTKDDLAEIAGSPPAFVVNDLWKALSSGSFDTMQTAVENLRAEGFSAQLLLSSLIPKLMSDQDLNEMSKATLAIRIAEAEKNMIEGGDEHLQLLTVCSLAVSCFESSRAMET